MSGKDQLSEPLVTNDYQQLPGSTSAPKHFSAPDQSMENPTMKGSDGFDDRKYLEEVKSLSHGAPKTTYTTQDIPGVAQDMTEFPLSPGPCMPAMNFAGRVNVVQQDFPTKVWFHEGKFNIDLRYLPDLYQRGQEAFHKQGWALLAFEDQKTKLLFNKTVGTTGVDVTLAGHGGPAPMAGVTHTIRLGFYILIRRDDTPDPFHTTFRNGNCVQAGQTVGLNPLFCCFTCGVSCLCGGACYAFGKYTKATFFVEPNLQEVTKINNFLRQLL